MHIYDRIRERRAQLKMSQDELAKKCGYSDKSSISKIEKGLSAIPEGRLFTISRALNTSVAYLVGQTPNPDEQSNAIFAFDFNFVCRSADQSTLEGIDFSKIESRAQEIRKQANSKSVMPSCEIQKSILEAESNHIAYIEQICFNSNIAPEDYADRIRYVTSFIQNNENLLRSAMPGATILDDDMQEAERIRQNIDDRNSDKK